MFTRGITPRTRDDFWKESDLQLMRSFTALCCVQDDNGVAYLFFYGELSYSLCRKTANASLLSYFTALCSVQDDNGGAYLFFYGELSHSLCRKTANASLLSS